MAMGVGRVYIFYQGEVEGELFEGVERYHSSVNTMASTFHFEFTDGSWVEETWDLKDMRIFVSPQERKYKGYHIQKYFRDGTMDDLGDWDKTVVVGSEREDRWPSKGALQMFRDLQERGPLYIDYIKKCPDCGRIWSECCDKHRRRLESESQPLLQPYSVPRGT